MWWRAVGSTLHRSHASNPLNKQFLTREDLEKDTIMMAICVWLIPAVFVGFILNLVCMFAKGLSLMGPQRDNLSDKERMENAVASSTVTLAAIGFLVGLISGGLFAGIGAAVGMGIGGASIMYWNSKT